MLDQGFCPNILPLLQRVVVVVITLFAVHYARRRLSSRPPGPLGLPIVGNVLDLQRSRDPASISALRRKYGDAVYIEAFGQPIVMLNGQAAVDLLDKRGAIYSDRPHFTMASDYSGMGDLTPIMHYGEKYQHVRRLMNHALSPRAVVKWEPYMIEEAQEMLRRIMSKPHDFVQHFSSMAGSLVMMSLYGHRVTSDDDPLIKLALEFMDASTYAIVGRWIVDYFPLAKWIPGLPFRRQAEEWKARLADWIDRPFDAAKADIHVGEETGNSLCGSLMMQNGGSAVDSVTEYRIKWIAASTFGAGIETTVATLSHFVMAMALHPQAQARAQEEIDKVVGRERLPSFSDRSSLPYMECVFKEVLRWGTPSALTVPHRLMEDDVYENYTLPAGTICIGNLWGLLHDERMYDNPEDFRPERFEGLDAQTAKAVDPKNFVYGFGRRRCPGNRLAHSATWMGIASVLAMFTIKPDVDVDGNEIEIRVEFEAGAIRHTKPFRCRFELRHAKAADLLL